jgi:hypothetical protein
MFTVSSSVQHFLREHSDSFEHSLASVKVLLESFKLKLCGTFILGCTRGRINFVGYKLTHTHQNTSGQILQFLFFIFWFQVGLKFFLNPTV